MSFRYISHSSQRSLIAVSNLKAACSSCTCVLASSVALDRRRSQAEGCSHRMELFKVLFCVTFPQGGHVLHFALIKVIFHSRVTFAVWPQLHWCFAEINMESHALLAPSGARILTLNEVKLN